MDLVRMKIKRLVLVGLFGFLLVGCNLSNYQTDDKGLNNGSSTNEELGQGLEQDYLSNWYALFDEELTNKFFNADAW